MANRITAWKGPEHVKLVLMASAAKKLNNIKILSVQSRRVLAHHPLEGYAKIQ